MSAVTGSYEAVDRAVDDCRETIDLMALDLWQLAEVSLQEIRSAELLLAALEHHGFTITSRSTAGLPTAFIAEWDAGEPKLGILLEHDALPGLGNGALAAPPPARMA